MGELEKIVSDYHFNTEHHDRLFCTGVSPRDSRTAMPRTPEENRKVQLNARQELLQALSKTTKKSWSIEIEIYHIMYQ